MTARKSFRLEAEDLQLQFGLYKASKASFASGDSFVFAAPGTAVMAQGAFTGEAGHYKVVVHYFDESDGRSSVKLSIGDNTDNFVMDDGQTSSRASADSATSRVSFDSVRLDTGDRIDLNLRSDGRELAAIDYIEFIPVSAPAPAIPTPPAPFPAAPVPAAPIAAEPAVEPPVAEQRTLEAFEMQVVALTNEIRESRGLGALRINMDLSDAAESHSQDMADNRFFGHVSSDGDRLHHRTGDAGYDNRYVGENIAAGHNTPEQVVASWMRSPGHRANILNPKFNEIGVGFVEKDNSQYDEYWTQVFGYDALIG